MFTYYVPLSEDKVFEGEAFLFDKYLKRFINFLNLESVVDIGNNRWYVYFVLKN